jgi:hypothetical protein
MHAMQARAREDVVVLDNGGSSIKAGLASAPHAVRCATAHAAARSRTLAPPALTRAPPARAQLRAQLRGQAEGREAAVRWRRVGGVP